MLYLAYIRVEHARSYQAYDHKRVTDELKNQGIVIGKIAMPRAVLPPPTSARPRTNFPQSTNSVNTCRITKAVAR